MITPDSFYVAVSTAIERSPSDQATGILRTFAYVARSLAIWAQELTPEERQVLNRMAMEMNHDADDMDKENEQGQEAHGPETAA